jgi:hypothetical protein
MLTAALRRPQHDRLSLPTQAPHPPVVALSAAIILRRVTVHVLPCRRAVGLEPDGVRRRWPRGRTRRARAFHGDSRRRELRAPTETSQPSSPWAVAGRRPPRGTRRRVVRRAAIPECRALSQTLSPPRGGRRGTASCAVAALRAPSRSAAGASGRPASFRVASVAPASCRHPRGILHAASCAVAALRAPSRSAAGASGRPASFRVASVAPASPVGSRAEPVVLPAVRRAARRWSRGRARPRRAFRSDLLLAEAPGRWPGLP